MNVTKKLSLTVSAMTIGLVLAASPAMAFVDRDHSAEGVSQSATRYTGTSQPRGGFVDYDHSASAGPSEHSILPGSATYAKCGFLDCDHMSSPSES